MTKKTEIKKVRCNICSAGCPIDAYVQDGKLLSVAETGRDSRAVCAPRELHPGSMYTIKTGFYIR